MRIAIFSLLASVSYGQSWEVGQTFAYLPQAATVRPTVATSATVAPRLRITASLQTIATLRAVSLERVPEATGLYSVRACNVSPDAFSIDGGQVEQAIESRGIAISTRTLAQLAVQRSRSRGASLLAKLGEVAQIAAPLVLGAAAGGVVNLSGAWAAAVAATGTGLRIIGESSRSELDRINAPVADLGAWLSDSRSIALAAGECSPRLLVLGSYQRGQARTITIESQ